MKEVLRQFDYDTITMSLSSIAREHADESEPRQPFDKVTFLQKAGSRARREAEHGDVLALGAIAEIHQSRELEKGLPQPKRKTAHLLRSLKHPAEVEAFRRVYGVGFFLIGLQAAHSARVANLKFRGMSTEQAEKLIETDQSEVDPLGQQTRKTFHLADAFIADGDRDQLLRFLDLIFGSPFLTPTPDEYAMFLAFGASMRSAQPGRQVGAVVVSEKGEVIATGANDVPCFGGGLYWSTDAHDCRDHVFQDGIDSNKAEIARIADGVRAELQQHLKEGVDPSVIDTAIKNSRLKDISEFGRAVHAEMEALLACARTGVSAHGGTLYTTTFPCHNCAKHIVDAGITRVVYVEPYPKSRAYDLHADSIAITEEGPQKKVQFTPFVGIAARRYFDLFSVRLGSGSELERKGEGGGAAKWTREKATVRPRMSQWSYIDRERRAVKVLKSYHGGKAGRA